MKKMVRSDPEPKRSRSEPVRSEPVRADPVHLTGLFLLLMQKRKKNFWSRDIENCNYLYKNT